MSDEAVGFAAPAFDAHAALTQLQRSLRDLKLAARGHAFELRGKRVVELELTGGAILARVARRLALSPEWDGSTIDSAAAQRKLVDDIKKRLERWERDE